MQDRHRLTAAQRRGDIQPAEPERPHRGQRHRHRRTDRLSWHLLGRFSHFYRRDPHCVVPGLPRLERGLRGGANVTELHDPPLRRRCRGSLVRGLGDPAADHPAPNPHRARSEEDGGRHGQRRPLRGRGSARRSTAARERAATPSSSRASALRSSPTPPPARRLPAGRRPAICARAASPADSKS